MAKTEPKYPAKVKLRRLREERRLSMEALGEQIGANKLAIYRLEKGYSRYNETTLKRLAAALRVSEAELLEDELGASKAPGLAEDAAPYDPGESPRSLPELGPHESAYRIDTHVLDQKGLLPGDVIIFDFGAERMAKLRDGDIVVVQHYGVDGDFSAKTIVRQYLGPYLLLGNSSRMEIAPLHLMKDDVSIKGVMVSSHRLRS